MTKIWTIEENEHPSSRVVGAFSTRENAELALASHKARSPRHSVAWIEERNLDTGIEQIGAGLTPYQISFHRKTGNHVSSLYTYAVGPDVSEGHNKYGDTYVVWAKNELSAIKIAAERHAQWRATQAGIA